jgi:hypothetical protein
VNEKESPSRWNERRAVALMNISFSDHPELKAEHRGESNDVDFHIFRGLELVGKGEVKTDIDPRIAASRDALVKFQASIIDSPENSGDWAICFSPISNIKILKQELKKVIALAGELGLTFLSPESLWDDNHLQAKVLLKRLGIAYMWREEFSQYDRVFLIQQPWGGQIPDNCPPLQNWVDEILSTHRSKQSISMLGGHQDLEQKHLVFCIDSNSPIPIQLYVMHHGLDLPSEKVVIPSWVTHLWVILPRQFQERDIAWRYSPKDGWVLIAADGFLEF